IRDFHVTGVQTCALPICIVDSIDEAMAHIARWSSGHTEAIVTDSLTAANRFQREVDSSSVYVNLPTVFADGFEYGLGAEIGISRSEERRVGKECIVLRTT